MDFYNDNVKVNICVEMNNQIQENFIKKYFPCEKIEYFCNELYDGKCGAFISNTKISREDFYKFMKDLTNQKEDFEVQIDSDEKYVYEVFSFVSNNDFIIRRFLPEKYYGDNGRNHLIGIVFHNKEEKIALENL